MEVWDVVDKAITEYEALKLSGISEDTPTAAIEMAKRASKRKQASERYGKLVDCKLDENHLLPHRVQFYLMMHSPS